MPSHFIQWEAEMSSDTPIFDQMVDEFGDPWELGD